MRLWTSELMLEWVKTFGVVWMNLFCTWKGHTFGGTWGRMFWTECFCSPQIPMLNPTPPYDGIRRWRPWDVIWTRWGHEPGARTMAISALIGVTSGIASSLRSSAWENTMEHMRCAVWRRALTRCHPCRHPSLKLPASVTVRNKVSLFVSHLVYGIFLLQPKRRRPLCTNIRIARTWVFV